MCKNIIFLDGVIELPNYDDGSLLYLDKRKNKFCHSNRLTNDEDSIEAEVDLMI